MGRGLQDRVPIVRGQAVIDISAEAVVILVAMLGQMAWRFVVRPLWVQHARAPFTRGDLVVAPPRADVVYRVLSYPRPGFVAVRQRGMLEGKPHPIIVVDPTHLRRVRRAS